MIFLLTADSTPDMGLRVCYPVAVTAYHNPEACLCVKDAGKLASLLCMMFLPYSAVIIPYSCVSNLLHA